ncbi:hypothetical protein OsJ_19939 [Oryza sativa Japonica Group]|uniref:Uncharacterized protein n=1 Tax=Oryza sativa subsp. japonica TaxID=39947 RepID=A3B7W3_ORYSJ|nr:hypothetical protein OsJ_19939 [Oryza sativa Japonica Group]
MAAIAGTLAASAIVIVTSVVLSPTRISFSVTGGGASISPSAGGQAFLLNLTIAADNPSHRAGVQYLAFAVSLQQFTARNRMESVEATVQEGVPVLPAAGELEERARDGAARQQELLRRQPWRRRRQRPSVHRGGERTGGLLKLDTETYMAPFITERRELLIRFLNSLVEIANQAFYYIIVLSGKFPAVGSNPT